MVWWRSWKADPVAVAFAAGHYSRRRRAKPNQRQWCPPGRGVPLRVYDGPGAAVWHSHWPDPAIAMHGRGDAWLCSIFRNEGAGLSSDLIVQALAATRFEFGAPPDEGTLTFIDRDEILSPNPGYCFKVVGFVYVGKTKDRGLDILQLAPELHPPAEPPAGRLPPGCGTPTRDVEELRAA